MIFFWDLDGVLANFNTAAKNLIADAGLPMPKEDSYFYLHEEQYKEALRPIKESQAFWDNLEPYEEAIEAFHMVKDQSFILSAPGIYTVAATPKYNWCAKHLGIDHKQVILASSKYLLAPDKFSRRILFDDRAKACQEFVNNGGEGVVVEHPYSYQEGITRKNMFRSIKISTAKELPSVVRDMTKETIYG